MYYEAAIAQYGLVSYMQLRATLTDNQIRRRVARGDLVRLHRGLYRCAGAPSTWRQRALSACMAYGGAILSHRSAARLWEIEGIASPVPEVTIQPQRSGRMPGVITHRKALMPVEVTNRWSIPVTVASRTIIDLASTVPAGALERAIDDVLRRRLVTIEHLAEAVESARRSVAARMTAGCAGWCELSFFVSERASRPGIGDSARVDEVCNWIVEAGLPAPTRQHQVVIRGCVRWLDMAYPGMRIAIEFDGWQHHQTRSRFDSDRARTAELALAGWLVIQVTSRHPRADVVDRVRRAIAERSARPAIENSYT